MTKWGAIQFHHHDDGFRGFRYTVAVDVPSSQELRSLVSSVANGEEVDPISISIGHTIVNPKDKYDRRIGRDLSSLRMQVEQFKISHFVLRVGRAELVLFSNRGVYLNIRILTNKDATPYLIDVWGLKGDRE